MALATRPLLHQLYATVHQMLRTAHDKMPIWSSAAAMAFMAGWAGAMIWTHTSRRRWRAQQMRTDKAIPLLKSVCASCWSECDLEESGWLEPFEARVCLSRILDTLQEPGMIVQLASVIAASSSGSSTAMVDPTSDVSVEVRALLSKLLSDLSHRTAVDAEFAAFLEHIEARPAQAPHAFTPPAGQKRASKENGSGSARSAADSARSVHSATSASSTASQSSEIAPTADATSPISSRSSSFSHSTATAAAAALDRRVFRHEFLTACLYWLEAHIIRRMFSTEQNGA